MKEKISLYKKRSFETLQRLSKKQKTFLAIGILLVVSAVSTIVYATGNHDEAEPVVQTQTEQEK
jgi:flagellar biosynthesis/type III secretory pathway M-ring protein FliF/YscJ